MSQALHLLGTAIDQLPNFDSKPSPNIPTGPNEGEVLESLLQVPSYRHRIESLRILLHWRGSANFSSR
jgi:hypothetical protein